MADPTAIDLGAAAQARMLCQTMLDEGVRPESVGGLFIGLGIGVLSKMGLTMEQILSIVPQVMERISQVAESKNG